MCIVAKRYILHQKCLNKWIDLPSQEHVKNVKIDVLNLNANWFRNQCHITKGKNTVRSSGGQCKLRLIWNMKAKTGMVKKVTKYNGCKGWLWRIGTKIDTIYRSYANGVVVELQEESNAWWRANERSTDWVLWCGVVVVIRRAQNAGWWRVRQLRTKYVRPTALDIVIVVVVKDVVVDDRSRHRSRSRSRHARHATTVRQTTQSALYTVISFWSQYVVHYSTGVKSSHSAGTYSQCNLQLFLSFASPLPSVAQIFTIEAYRYSRYRQ